MSHDYDVISEQIHRLQDNLDKASITEFERGQLMKMIQGILDGKKVYGF